MVFYGYDHKLSIIHA